MLQIELNTLVVIKIEKIVKGFVFVKDCWIYISCNMFILHNQNFKHPLGTQSCQRPAKGCWIKSDLKLKVICWIKQFFFDK